MRTKSVIKNTSIAIISSICLAFFKLILRKVFLIYFDVTLLGYEGLFTSVFTVLSIAEMGSSSVFGFMLYKAVAECNNAEESVVMAMYKKLYQLIGAFVLVSGMLIFIFLQSFLPTNNYDLNYARLIYIIQLATTLITYFMSYKRSLLFAMQKSYVVVIISSIFDIVGCVIRIILIVLFKNYICYLIVPLFTNFITNLIISLYCRQNYPNVIDVKVTYNDYKNRGVFVQLKSILVSKISTILYTTSDSIIISLMIGIKQMGLYSNYLQFVGIGKTFLLHFSEPLGHSIGNLVYTENIDKHTSLYKCIDLLGTYIGIISFVISTCIFQRVIQIFFGSQFLLSNATVVIVSLDFYVRCRGLAYCAFRSAVGYYEETQYIDAAAAVSNIILSILFALKFGLEGILFATVIGNILIQAGRAKITFKYSVNVQLHIEILKEIYNLLILFIIFIVSYNICNLYSRNIIGLMLALISSIIVSILLVFLFTFKEIKSSYFTQYFKDVINIFLYRFLKGK